jgi:hypothetical protein
LIWCSSCPSSRAFSDRLAQNHTAVSQLNRG